MFRLFFVYVLGFAICIAVGCAWFTGSLLFRESLKDEDFCGFLGSVQIKIRFFCLIPSLSSQLENSAELTDFSRFIPSCTESLHTAVSGIVFNSVRTEAVTTLNPDLTAMSLLEGDATIFEAGGEAVPGAVREGWLFMIIMGARLSSPSWRSHLEARVRPYRVSPPPGGAATVNILA